MEKHVQEDFLNWSAEEFFGIPYIFPYQRLVIANVLEGAGYFGGEGMENGRVQSVDSYADIPRRQIVILPTGAGKSLCFMLPGVLLNGITLILFPLLSLMSDQMRRLAEQEIPTEVISGGQGREEREAAWRRLASSPDRDDRGPGGGHRDSDGGHSVPGVSHSGPGGGNGVTGGGRPKFLLSNPETLVQPGSLRRLAALPIDHLVVDEAHTVPMWGREFRPALTQIPEIIAAAEPRMISAFTATASDDILSAIQELLFPDGPAHVTRANPDRPNISYHVIPVISKNRELRRLLTQTIQWAPPLSKQRDLKPRRVFRTHSSLEGAPGPLENPNLLRGTQCRPEGPNPLRVPRPALIFCPTRETTEKLAARLRRDLGEKEIFFYHAGLERAEKKTIEEWFFHSAGGVLCATTAYGMGVDKKNIRTVIHHSLSLSTEAFLQESGRAGRDGDPSYSIVLLSPGDEASAEAVPRQSGLCRALKDRSSCVREKLLALMGSECDICSGCDICRNSRPQLPEGFRELFSFFQVHRYLYTPHQASEILAGGLLQRSEMEAPPHHAGVGALSAWHTGEIEEAIFTLIAAGYLKRPLRGPWRRLVGVPIRPLRRRHRLHLLPYVHENLSVK